MKKKMLHNLVLQRLNQTLRNFGADVFYPRDTFAKVDYTGRPVIFWDGEGSPIHPDFDEVTAGRLPAGYRVVGQIANTRIEGDLQRADALITDGALSAEIAAHPDRFAVSTGFWGHIADRVMRAVDATNHVLLFRRARGAPNDEWSQVCNTRDNNTIFPIQLESGVKTANMTDAYKFSNPAQVGNTPDQEPSGKKPTAEEQMTALAEENADLKALAQQQGQKIEELLQVLQALQSQMQAAQAPPNATPQAPAATVPMAAPVGNTAEYNRLLAENDRMKKQLADADWEKLESTLPSGMRGVAGRLSYDSDPLAFLRRAVAVGNTQPTKTVPEQYSASVGSAQPPEPQQRVQTFATDEYAYARQIGNVAAQSRMEGARLGPHMWSLTHGMKLDSTEIDATLANRRIGRQYGVI